MIEVAVASKCNALYLSYTVTGSHEHFYEFCMKIKTLMLKVLNEFSDMKGSIEILQEEIRRMKIGVVDSTEVYQKLTVTAKKKEYE
jgi:hypothetical protein